MEPRKPYPSDVSDEEWTSAAPYLTLMNGATPSAASPATSSDGKTASRQDGKGLTASGALCVRVICRAFLW